MRSTAIIYLVGMLCLLSSPSYSHAQSGTTHTSYWLGAAGTCGSIYSGAYAQDCSGLLPANTPYENEDPNFSLPGPDLVVDLHGGTWDVHRSSGLVRVAWGPDGFSATGTDLTTISIPGGANSIAFGVRLVGGGYSTTGHASVRLKKDGVVVQDWTSDSTQPTSNLFPRHDQPRPSNPWPNNNQDPFVASISGVEFDEIELSASGNTILEMGKNGSQFWLGGVDPNAVPGGGGGGGGTPVECLVNGGFEEPAIGANTFLQISASSVLGWNTVRYGRMEFIPYWYGAHPEGVQAIELNSDGGNETIYQDFDTTPGSTIDFSFFHHNNPSNIVDQVDVRFGPPGATTSAGIFSTVGNGWTQQAGSYNVPAGQVLTRMEIVSLNPAGNGNLLDGVSALSSGCGTTAPVDTDGDGVPDDDDAFPNDPTESVDTDGDGVGDNGDAFPNDPNESADTDGDSVGDNGDMCAATVYDTMELNPNQWALREGSTDFIQGVTRKGKSSGGSYTIAQTGGCSCSDIVEAAGHGKGHLKKGCSNSVMADWTAHVAGTLGKGGTPSESLSQRLDANQETGDAALPTEFVLTGNYPNPFNPQTSIEFGLPESAHVTLAIYDLMGRRVRMLVDGPLSAGMHSARFNAGSLPSGAYLYQLTTPAGSITKTMMLLK